jgi:hypothetical protein
MFESGLNSFQTENLHLLSTWKRTGFWFNLFGQEIHPTPLGETLGNSGIELSRRQRDGYAALNVEGDHEIE